MTDDDLALAERLADAAGDAIRPFYRARFTIETKADASPVTEVDRAAEQAIRAILARERPNDGVVGEEYGADRPDAERVWVLDPIDGTRAFLAGRPLFGTLIALLEGERPVLGIIDQPIARDRWLGAAGRRTSLNGKQAATRACAGLAAAHLATTGPTYFGAADGAAFERLRARCRDTLWGGDCHNYGLLASGHLDLVVEAGLKLHDYAALIPIVEGAGGRMTDWAGQPLGRDGQGRVIAAGDPALLEQTVALLGRSRLNLAPLRPLSQPISRRYAMATVTPMIHEDGLPGSEATLDPRPQYEPRFPGSGRLKGKVAIVTGADSGIGRAVAVLYAREGADVAIVYLNEHEDAAETKAACEREGARAITIPGDIGDKAFCDAAVAQAVEALGRLDILVNNAGEQHPDKDIRDITEAQLRRTFQTNIFGMFFMVQAARPHLKAGSAIVNCTSETNYIGNKDLLDYSATKGAITAFTRSLSENLVKDGIRVNGVAPGPIWTPLNPCGGADAEKIAHFGESSPMGRPGQPNEVAPAFLFLACEDASYMSGQVLHPNGGTIVNG